ncbi:MAG: hypothetical protein ALAOOOJD_03864 [bacterium]|nr:hypothetical protein [bacterium]
MSAKTLSPKKRMLVKRVGIAGLKRKMAGFEKKYGMSTQIFLKKIDRGELSESNDFIDWLGLAELYRNILARRSK